MTRLLALTAALTLFACADDEETADDIGIAWTCQATEDCPVLESEDEEDTGDIQLECLLDYTGGYCVLPDCSSNADCPEDGVCVTHTDGNNYCFRGCQEKVECNENRPKESEANCSSDFVFADEADEGSSKACIPSSAGE